MENIFLQGHYVLSILQDKEEGIEQGAQQLELQQAQLPKQK